MLQLAECCKLQQKINILCHPTRPALTCPWFWHFYLHAKHTRGPSWMARRFRILWSSKKWKSSAKNQRIWGYLVDMNNFVRCNYTRSPREHAPKRWAQQGQLNSIRQLQKTLRNDAGIPCCVFWDGSWSLAFLHDLQAASILSSWAPAPLINSLSAVNYNRKSIFWCAATRRVL